MLRILGDGGGMGALPGVLRIKTPTILWLQDPLDQVADATTAAIELGDPVGRRPDLGDGIGRTDAQAGEFHRRNVRNIIADERHLRRIDADPAAEMEQIFRLVF